MLHLLPLNSKNILNSRKEKLSLLLLIEKITQEALEALEAFMAEKYKSFDAQVGDTSCQIRAYKIYLLTKDSNFLSVVLTEHALLITYLNTIKQVLSEFQQKMTLSYAYDKELDSKQSVSAFLMALKLNAELSPNIKFIILAFFLKKFCVMDKNEIPQAINYELIKTAIGIGSTPARQLANHYQAMLAKLSCDFVLSLLPCYPISDGNFDLLAYLLRRGDRGRNMLPYYNETKVLLLSTLSSSIPIMLSIDCIRSQRSEKLVLLFKQDCLTRSFRLQQVTSLSKSSETCVVFKGEVWLHDEKNIDEYIKNLLSYSPLDLILANAAAHPQYAGLIQEEFKSHPYQQLSAQVNKKKNARPLIKQMERELNRLRTDASLVGCSRDNPRLFFIKHIFCDLVKNEAIDHLFYQASSFNSLHFHSILLEQLEPIAA